MDNLTNKDTGDLFAEDSSVDTASSAVEIRAEVKKPADQKLVERAFSFFEDGSWGYRPALTCDSLFYVHNQEQDICHIVFLGTEKSEGMCTCGDFDTEKTCVHLLAVEAELSFTAWVDEQERLHAYSEHPIHGTDPDMHYDRAGNTPG